MCAVDHNHDARASDATATPIAVRPATVRIGVLDNDALALDCIRRMLESQSRGVTYGVSIWTSTSPAYAIQECRNGKATDVLLIDMALNGVTGPQVASEILKRSPGTVIIGMTSYALEAYRNEAMHAGITVLLDKAAFGQRLLGTIERILEAHHKAMQTHREASRNGRTDAGERADGTQRPLSPIERDIVALSLGAMTTRQIGTRLGITANTVSSHRRNIKRKLGVGTWLEALDRCRALHIA